MMGSQRGTESFWSSVRDIFCIAYIMRKINLKIWLQKTGILLFAVLVIVSLLYSSCWQGRMQSVVTLRTHLQEEEAGQYARALLNEAECFPVRRDSRGKETWYYDNGYGAGRTYGGNRSHEGIDIMTSNNQSGYFQIQSVSDGVVEQMGWLELGGYRIGIRSESGLYYYYAHMAAYAGNLEKGDRVRAGQILGYMGDTGYGPEGTRGKFDVHLHFGIYRLQDGEEKSVNPYYLLQYLEYGRIPDADGTDG